MDRHRVAHVAGAGGRAIRSSAGQLGDSSRRHLSSQREHIAFRASHLADHSTWVDRVLLILALAEVVAIILFPQTPY